MTSEARRRWADRFFDVDLAVLRQLIVCGVRLDEPRAVAEAIRGEVSLQERDAHIAMQWLQLRALLRLHARIRRGAIDAMGFDETAAVVERTLANLAKRIGGAGAMADNHTSFVCASS